MAHVRKQLRDAAKAMLDTALPLDEIGIGRVRPAEKSAGVTIGVYTSAEASRDSAMGGEQERRIRLRVDMTAKGNEADVLDLLDGRAVTIEKAVAADETFGGIAMATSYRGTDANSSMEGERPFLVLSILFDVTVNTINSDPETAL